MTGDKDEGKHTPVRTDICYDCGLAAAGPQQAIALCRLHRAAPSLLAALQRTLTALTEKWASADGAFQAAQQQAAINAARAAIAQAEGKE